MLPCAADSFKVLPMLPAQNHTILVNNRLQSSVQWGMLLKKDELFGTIIFEGLWKGETNITIFERSEKATL